MSQDVDTFLAHYGVMGMRWGVRKDETPNLNTVKSAKSSVGNKELTAEQKARRNRLIAIGIGAAVVILAAGTTYAVVKSNAKIKADIISRLQIKHAITWKKKAGLIGDMSVSELKKKVVDPINPNYGSPGTKTNCMRATMAYEMRRRGYDVRATVVSAHRANEQSRVGRALVTDTTPYDMVKGTTNTPIHKILNPIVKSSFINVAKSKSILGDNIINNVPRKPEAMAASIFKVLGENPPKARGELGLTGILSGHSMAWEMVKGKPVIIDAQRGKMYDTPQKLATFLHNGAFTCSGYTRLDNKELNMQFLERWLTDAD